MAEFGKKELVDAVFTTWRKLEAGEAIPITGLNDMVDAVGAYIDNYQTYFAGPGYLDNYRVKLAVLAMAYIDFPEDIFKFVFSRLFPDRDFGKEAGGMLLAHIGPEYAKVAYKPKSDDVLKTDSYKVEHCLNNVVMRCNDAVAMMYEYEVRLDQVVREYVRQCFEKLRDVVNLSEREVRELVVVRAHNELCVPAFHKAVRVIFDTCPVAVASLMSDEILERHVGRDYRNKFRDWYREHKTL